MSKTSGRILTEEARPRRRCARPFRSPTPRNQPNKNPISNRSFPFTQYERPPNTDDNDSGPLSSGSSEEGRSVKDEPGGRGERGGVVGDCRVSALVSFTQFRRTRIRSPERDRTTRHETKDDIKAISFQSHPHRALTYATTPHTHRKRPQSLPSQPCPPKPSSKPSSRKYR